jgi:hypothetical protein
MSLGPHPEYNRRNAMPVGFAKRTSRGGHVMGVQYDISRHHMLAMSAATIAMSAMGAHAQAPAAKRIEQFEPRAGLTER